jgi:hypothetical protein
MNSKLFWQAPLIGAAVVLLAGCVYAPPPAYPPGYYAYPSYPAYPGYPAYAYPYPAYPTYPAYPVGEVGVGFGFGGRHFR